MIVITDKCNCTGCGSCVAACKFGAISLVEDEEGFFYPQVNEEKCVNCGRCDQICPMLDTKHGILEQNKSENVQFFAGQLKAKNELLEVSSGGAFWAFAKEIIAHGGVVYGAVQTEIDVIRHMRADNIEAAKLFRKSKYFQSIVGDCYTLLQSDLKAGKLVLFSGTGCQIAGLNSFLGKSYDNLYTCDIVCHGVPSMKAWRSYRKENEEKLGKKMVNLEFRDKSQGWNRNQYKITYADGSVHKEPSVTHLFHAGYLQGLFYRPSCGQCIYAKMPRVSDVTLADFWKYTGALLEDNTNLGISLIVANNRHGMELIGKAKEYLQIEEASKESAIYSCFHLNQHPMENPKRADFFKLLDKKGYYKAAKKFIKRNSLLKRIFRKLKLCIKK